MTFRARFLARQAVACGWARRALVQLAYAIGVAEPVSVLVVTEAGQGGESRAEHDAELADRLRGEFDLDHPVARPAAPHLLPHGGVRALRARRPSAAVGAGGGIGVASRRSASTTGSGGMRPVVRTHCNL